MQDTPQSASEVQLPGRIQYIGTRQVQIAPGILERRRIAALANDPAANAFRLLRTEILLQMLARGWKTLAITSPNKGAGKSTVSLNLAIAVAMEVDQTALLVEADLRDPDLRNILNLNPGPGLPDYLMGDAALEDLLIHPDIANLVLLPGGAAVPNSSELLRSPKMAELIGELRDRYPNRMIFFDVPPILSGGDTLALSSFMDATILLVAEGETSRDDITRSCELLREANLLGIVLNKSRRLRKPDPMTRRRPQGFFHRLFGTGD